MENNELWTDFKAMLKDIKSNSTLKVEQFDLPEEKLFGYKSNDKVWQIKITDINTDNNDTTGAFQIISTDTGKQKLLEALNEGK